LGFGSSTVGGGGGSYPGWWVLTSSEMFEGAEDTHVRTLSFASEGPGSCLNMSLPADLSSHVFEGFSGWAVEVAPCLLLPTGFGTDASALESSMHASSPVQASTFPGMLLLVISSLVSTFSGSPSAIASSTSALPPKAVGVPFGCLS
jgi:hypothetical protein